MEASPNTIAGYRDTFRLLLRFASEESGKAPTKLTIEHLDVTLISNFLAHTESQRRNSARSRNTRLAAIRSFFRFVAIRGTKLSRDALEQLVQKYTRAASKSCPSLIRKRVSPHVLRHSTAMQLLHHGVDQSVIALWLGHESVETTEIYIHADLRLKERALARLAAPASKPGRYRPNDTLLAFLEAL